MKEVIKIMTMEKVIPIIFILATILIGIEVILILFTPNKTEYPLTTVVSEVDYNTDIVTCVDFNGNEWKFENCEDWLVGDYCSMIMNDNGTPNIYDDKIISTRYSGWLEGGFGLTTDDEFVIEN